MSTQSSIAIQKPDGTVEAIYCNWDGGLWDNGVGDTLNQHYRRTRRIQSLMRLGSISILAPKVKPRPGIPHGFDTGPEYQPLRQTDVTLAYGRDRGEQGCESQTFKDVDTWNKRANEQYNYLWSNGDWTVNGVPLRVALVAEDHKNNQEG